MKIKSIFMIGDLVPWLADRMCVVNNAEMFAEICSCNRKRTKGKVPHAYRHNKVTPTLINPAASLSHVHKHACTHCSSGSHYQLLRVCLPVPIWLLSTCFLLPVICFINLAFRSAHPPWLAAFDKFGCRADCCLSVCENLETESKIKRTEK